MPVGALPIEEHLIAGSEAAHPQPSTLRVPALLHRIHVRVERKVTRIVTPGTLTDSALLEDKRDNLLLALHRTRTTLGIAWRSLAAGRFAIMETLPS